MLFMNTFQISNDSKQNQFKEEWQISCGINFVIKGEYSNMGIDGMSRSDVC